MKQTVMSVLALVGAFALAGGAFFLWSNRPGRTAVSVNGRILTARELDWRAQTLIDDAKRMEKLIIPEREMKEAMRHYRRTAAKMWIVKEVLLAAAVESGVKATADDEKASLARVAIQLKSRNLTPEQFFKEGPIPEETKRSDFKEAVLIGKYTKHEIEDKLFVETKAINDRIGELRELNAKVKKSGGKPRFKADRKTAIEMLRQEKYNVAFRDLFRAKFGKMSVACPMFPDLESVDAVSPSR